MLLWEAVGEEFRQGGDLLVKLLHLCKKLNFIYYIYVI